MIETTTHIKTDKKLLPQLRFKEFDGEWKVLKLKDVAKIARGKFTPRPRNNPIYYNGDIPFVQTSDVVNANGKIEVYTQTLNEKGLAVSKLFPAGTILITIAANIGHVGVLQIDMACPDSLIGITPNNETHNYFLNYYLATHQEKMDYLAPEGAQKNINIDFLNPYKVPSTSLPEQQKIASFLSAVDEKIQQLTKKKALLEQYKKGGLQQLFSGQLRFKDENGNPYPDWEEKRLKDVLHEHKTKNKDGSVTEVFSVAKQKGVVNQIEHLGRSFAAATTLHYKVAFPGDLIYTKSPTKDFPFGIIKQNLTGRKGLVSPLYVVTTPQTNSLGFMFHCYFLSWVNVYNYLVPLIQKGAKNTMNINNDEYLNGAKFMLPVSKKEQKKIARYLSSIDTKIEAINNQITQTQTFKKGLLQQMFV